MNEVGMTTTRYLSYFRSSSDSTIKLLSADFEDCSRYRAIRNPVATTWLISFKHINQHNPLAAEYLRFTCFLNERDISLSLLPPADGALEANKALGMLKGYAFITQREGQDLFDMHKLVQVVMRNWLKETGTLQESYSSVLRRLVEVFPLPKYENRGVWTKYMPHAQAVLESGRCHRRDGRVDLLNKVAVGYYMLGNSSQS